MTYKGQTLDAHGRLINVHIITPGQAFGCNFEDLGLVFAPSEALMITGETEDVFQIAVSQRATIKFLAREFVGDFFRADVREAKVQIWLEGELIFDGFVLPQTYSQGYVSVLDELEVNCIDRLSALQYIRWRNIGESGVDYDAMKARAEDLTIDEILTQVLSLTGSGDYSIMTSPLLEKDGLSALQGIKVNEEIFFGDDEDDAWTALDVLEHCLRYLNLHITQRGSEMVVFNWDDIKACPEIMIDSQRVFGTDANLSIGETFSRIEVTCRTQDAEELMPDPLDLDSCGSPYVSRSGYCTEYSMLTTPEKKDGQPGERNFEAFWHKGGVTERADRFLDMVGGATSGIYNDNMWRRDWWIRVLENPRWRFFSAQEGRKWNGAIPFNYSAESKWEYYPPRVADGKYENRVPDDLDYTGGGCLLQTFSGKTTFNRDDNSQQTQVDEAKYLIVGVGGVGGEFMDNADSNSAYLSKIKKRAEATPVAVFSGGVQRLSPADPSTTRYLDISGSIALAPFHPIYRTPQWCADLQSRHLLNPQNTFEGVGAVLMGEDKFRILVRRYYDPENPTTGNPMWGDPSGFGFLPENKKPEEDYTRYGLNMFQTDEASKIYKYEGAATSEGMTDYATVVPALRCMLIVGDKVLVQQYASLEGGAPSYKWERFKTREECVTDSLFYSQCFYLGFNPKIGDYLVGQEYKISETAHFAEGIEAEGTVIPIRESDQVSGEVTFLILGPADTWMTTGSGSGRIFTTDPIGDNELVDPSRLNYPGEYIMKWATAVWIKDFSIKVISDNAKLDPLDSNDIIYISDESEKFVNPKDDIELEIMSDLTSEERARLGVYDTLRSNVALNAVSKSGVTSVWDPFTNTQAKPEQIYVDYYYRETGKPRIELEQGIKADTDNPFFHTWRHQAMPGRRFYPLAVSRDVQASSATIRIRVI